MTPPIVTRRPKPNQRWWQKRAVNLTIAALTLIAILLLMNVTIIKNERHLATGQPVLLALAPVDPRGLMQGDYMALRYALADEIWDAAKPNPDGISSDEGYVVVKLDKHNVGQFVRLSDHYPREGLATNELPIYYRIRDGRVKLATNAFFFQEGHAKAYEAAEYGLFRVNAKGQPLLSEMVDAQFEVIKGTELMN